MEDCYFEQLGDDCINLHTNVMNVTEVFDDGISINYDKKVPIVSPIWAYATDGLTIEGNTFINCNNGGEDIFVHNCTDVKTENNLTK